jgi:hypothetical protein
MSGKKDKEIEVREEMQPLNICVVTFPLPSKSIYALLFDLVKILEPLSSRLYVLTGGVPEAKSVGKKVQIIDIGKAMPFRQSIHPSCMSTLVWILKNIYIQIKMSRAMFKISKDVDIVIFFIGIPYLLLPMLIAKIGGKKIVWY